MLKEDEHMYSNTFSESFPLQPIKGPSNVCKNPFDGFDFGAVVPWLLPWC